VTGQEIVHKTKAKKLQEIFLKLDYEKAYDRVNWDFLREVLLGKGFDPCWVHRAMGLVSRGQTAIAINGEVGYYFRKGRGVCQRGQLSPLLFDFVMGALDAIQGVAKTMGHISGLVPHLIPGGGPPVVHR
jgi:hypothetical protein